MKPIFYNCLKKTIQIILILLLSNSVWAQLPTSGLVAWYPFCGNTNDYSGNGYNMKDSGAVLTTDRFGSISCAYEFNGINNLIYYSTYFPVTTDITYSCWIDAYTIQAPSILYNGNSNLNGLGFVMDNGTGGVPGNKCGILFGGIGQYLPVPVTLNQWHQIILRKIGSTYEFIIDTVSFGTFTGTFNPLTNIFCLGIDNTNGTNAFNGKIDDVAVYNRALTDTEIKQLYHYNPNCSIVITGTCDSISLPDTIKVCKNGNVVLPAILIGTDSIFNILWTPATGLSDTSIFTPTLTVGTTSGWYHLTVESLLPGNLVVNGDFSAGNTGFTSGYTYVSGPGSLVPAGVYAITTDPHLDHSGAASFGDHTSGTGNMLAINGASTPIDVWCETITVTPNTYYNFSAWFANWSSDTSNNLPIMQFEINGTLIGTIFNFPHPDGLWTQFFTTWYSGTNTSISICINDQQTAAFGNDFAIDDISFQQLCIAKDSVYIAVSLQDTIYSHSYASACATDGPITLTAPTGYSSYLWNTGSTASSVSVSSSGAWWVDASGGSCSLFADTFYTTFKPMPVISLAIDTTICKGAVITLSSQQPDGAQYNWSSGSNASSINVSNDGNYSLTVTLDGCSATDSIQVNEITAPQPINLGADTTLCTGDKLPLLVNASEATYLWSDGSNGQSFQVSETGTYWVRVSNICGSAGDTINVAYEFCDIWFPSAFTPNGDGLNDIIRVVGSLAEYKDFSLSIYNRWGQRVFYTQDIYQGWDGIFNGTKQDLGTYFYMIFYSLNGKKSMMKGDFQLIR